jgi:hypothetical protein
MGLFLAKEYIKNESLNTEHSISLDYKNKMYMLKINEHFFCSDDDFLEVMYTGDEIKITYGNHDRIVINNINGTLSFSIIETREESKDRTHLTYPLTMAVSGIRLIKYTEEDYESKNSPIARYLEYKD